MNTHDIKEKYILKKLLEIISEFNQLFIQEKDIDIIPLRIQLITGFTLIDVLGNYWYEYLGKSGKPSQRFEEFGNKFLLTSKNKIYKNTILMKGADINSLYDLRSSLVHFYGMGKSNRYAIAANYSKSHNEKSTLEMVKRFRQEVPNLIFIQPTEFRDLIKEGTILMFKTMMDNIKKSKSDPTIKIQHILGIERIHRKLMDEGAEGVK